MSIKFYYGSGSPFSWYIWLVLEHKQLPYEFNLRSLQNGELKTPEYLAINPHGKVPTIVDDDFSIWEALTIAEYLEERYPENPIFPAELQDKARVRRLAAEVYSYLYPTLRQLMEHTLFNPENDSDPTQVKTAIKALEPELKYFENLLEGEYFADEISAVDFAIYPFLALVMRIDQRKPDIGVGKLIGPKLSAFMGRIEKLDYFNKTMPPHWRD